MDIATLADLLRETAEHHDQFEKAAPPHDWWDWYAPYINARQHGSTPDEASEAAGVYMKEVRGVLFPDNFAGLEALSENVNLWGAASLAGWRATTVSLDAATTRWDGSGRWTA